MAEWDASLNGRPHCTAWLKTFTERSRNKQETLEARQYPGCCERCTGDPIEI